MRRLAFLSLLFLLSCATAPRVAEPLPGEVRSADAASNRLSVGKSSKSDVRAMLGKGAEVDFDSGYSVWVYRQQLLENQSGPRRELVLLFTPDGSLAKTRIR